MKLLLTITVLILLAWGASPPATADATQDWTIIPGSNAGPIRANTTEAMLIHLLGASRVKREQFRVAPDGEPQLTTTIFPLDPVRIAHIVWREKQFGKKPAMVIIEAAGDGPPVTRWSVPPGVTLGTSLSTLETLNGKPFSINGFGWDLGGGIDWRGGKMEAGYARRGVGLVLGYGNWSALDDAEKQSISGEVNVLSTLPAVRKFGPTVSRIIFSF